MGFQITGNTFIDSTRSAFLNANTTIANNFTVQITDRTVYLPSTSPMEGTIAGFSAGGRTPPTAATDVVDRFLFANELTSSDHGDLSTARRLTGGHSSTTQGFVSGGYYAPAPGNVDIVEKYNFSSNVTAADHGDLSVARRQLSSHSSLTQGFVSGGIEPVTPRVDTIDKFPYASNVTASDHGDLFQATQDAAGQSSETHGYSTNGLASPTPVFNPNTLNNIIKFQFASNVIGTDVGDTTQKRKEATGNSSRYNGYTVAGDTNPPLVTLNTIDKFPFASDTNASDVGDIVAGVYLGSSQNSKEYGYLSGGAGNSFNKTMIQRFPFVVDNNASDVGDLTQARGQNAGAQD